MILNREQFDNKWADGNLSVVDWFDTTDSLFDKISELDKELTYELQNNRELMFELSELKNRTCKSCRFAELSSERYLPKHKCLLGINAVSFDFCCNRQEGINK